MHGQAFNSSNLGSEGPGFKSRLSSCFLRQGILLHFVSVPPAVQMCTGDILLGEGGNPAMERHPVQEGVVIFLGMHMLRKSG